MTKWKWVFALSLLLGLSRVAVLGEGCGVWEPDNPDEPDGSKTCVEAKEGEEGECDVGETVDTGCAHVRIALGHQAPNSELIAPMLRLHINEPMAGMYSPESLDVLAGYALLGMREEMDNGQLVRIVDVRDMGGGTTHLRFEQGQTVGVPYGESGTSTLRMRMTDAEGWSVVEDPTYYDLYTDKGDLWRFLALPDEADFLNLVLYRNAEGYEESANASLDVVRGENDELLQVLTASKLANFEVDSAFRYRVVFYARESVGDEKVEGVYPVEQGAEPLDYWVFENPETNSIQKLDVSHVASGQTNLYHYVFLADAGEWQLTRPDGSLVRESKGFDEEDAMFMTKEVRASDGVVLSKATVRMDKYSWGYTRASKTVGEGDASRTKNYAYYTEADGAYRYSKIKSRSSSDGSWTRYDYDTAGRKALEIKPWKNGPFESTADEAHAFYYDYTPLDANDTLLFNDQRPRTVTEKILGQIVSRTFRVFATNATSEALEIVEKGATPGSAYGDVGNLRTVTTYYGTNVPAYVRGRVKSIVQPDGKTETHAYAYGHYVEDNEPADCEFVADSEGWAWRETVTYGTTNALEGVAYRTLQKATVWDRYGNKVMEEDRLFTGSTNYERIAWTVRDYDGAGHEVAARHSDGTLEESNWSGACCGKESFTDRYGIETQYTYDYARRVLTERKIGTNTTTDILTTYTYDAVGRRLSTTVSAGGISLTTSNAYDILGRRTLSVDAKGLITRTTYSEDGRIVTNELPGGLTRITETYFDGQPAATYGTAQIGGYRDFGVNADGSRWSIQYTATNESPVWSRTVQNMLGQLVRTEKPAYGAGVTTNENTYNALGQLVKNRSGGMAATLHAYDDLGELVLTGMDANDNGSLDLASRDRIQSNLTRYVQLGDAWWLETRRYALPIDNAADSILLGLSRRSVSGSGCSCSAAESMTVDLYGATNRTVQGLDRSNKTVTVTAYAADSTNPAVRVTVNGLEQYAVTKTGSRMDYEYDALGRRVAARQTGGEREIATITHYDSAGLVDWTEDAAGNRTTYGYDTNTGRRVSVTDPMTNTTHTAYDLQGRVIGTWGATYPVAYEYDAYGRMAAMYTYRGTNAIASYSDVSVLLPSFDQTTWLYDEPTGLLTNKLYADSNGTAYTYTPDGKLASRLWARGITTEYAYDLLGQLTNINYSDSTPDVSFTIDRLGRQTEVEQTETGVPPVIHRFAYDPATLALTNETVMAFDQTNRLARTQDLLGRPSGIALGPDYTVAYGYDEVGRLDQVIAGEGVQAWTNTYAFVPGSDLSAGWAAGPLSFNRQYESNRDLLTRVESVGRSNLLSRYDYANDAVGRRIMRRDSGTAFAVGATNLFGYNERSEVTSAMMMEKPFQYAYDPIGNRLVSSAGGETNEYAANQLNQYLAVTGGAPAFAYIPAYDADGNCTALREWLLTWDGENRLIRAENGTSIVHYAYDYMSRRVRRTATDASPTVVTSVSTFVYNDWAMIRERTESGGTVETNRYFYGLDLSGTLQGAGTVGGLWLRTGAVGPMFYTYDANGNVSEIVDETGGVRGHYEYGPFGKCIAMSGDLASANPFRFSTKPQDETTGFLYYGYRDLDVEWGRWACRDFVEERDGPNLYSFVYNSAINYVDLLGRMTLVEHVETYMEEQGRVGKYGIGFWIVVTRSCTHVKDVKCELENCETESHYEDNMDNPDCDERIPPFNPYQRFCKFRAAFTVATKGPCCKIKGCKKTEYDDCSGEIKE